MVQYCMVCKLSSAKSDKSIIFHKFPKEDSRRKKWLNVLNIDSVNDSNRICSQHFAKSDYKAPTVASSRLLLKSTAIPSLHVRKSEKIGSLENMSTSKEKASETNKVCINLSNADSIGQEKENTDLQSNVDIEVNQETLKRPYLNDIDKDTQSLRNTRRLGDINVDEVVKSPTEAKICLEVALDTINDQRQKIKYYQTKLKRAENSISNLKTLLKNSTDLNLSLQTTLRNLSCE